MSRSSTKRRRNGERWRGAALYGAVAPTRPVAAALPGASLFAVHAPAGASTRIYYCEPATGRCSCGALPGTCAHLAAVASLAAPSRALPPLR